MCSFDTALGNRGRVFPRRISEARGLQLHGHAIADPTNRARRGGPNVRRERLPIGPRRPVPSCRCCPLQSCSRMREPSRAFSQQQRGRVAERAAMRIVLYEPLQRVLWRRRSGCLCAASRRERMRASRVLGPMCEAEWCDGDRNAQRLRVVESRLRSRSTSSARRSARGSRAATRWSRRARRRRRGRCPRRVARPPPNITGEIASVNSSTSPARRYCWMTSAPPAMRMSRSPATARAWRSALSMPSLTKVNVVPPGRTHGSRTCEVSTNTGVWNGASSGHIASPRSNMRLPMMLTPVRRNVCSTISIVGAGLAALAELQPLPEESLSGGSSSGACPTGLPNPRKSGRRRAPGPCREVRDIRRGRR